MALAAHLEQRRRPIDSRVGPRRKLHLDTAGSSSSGDAMNVMVHDLSETGLLLQTTAQLSLGEKIEVVLPHAGPTAASVVWGSNDFFGCRFEKRISHASVSAAQLQSGPRPVAASAEESAAPAGEAERAETFGARLRRLRKDRRMSLIGLARLVSVSKPTVWKWEKDEVRPRQKSLEALAAVLGVSERELLFGQKAAEPQPMETAQEGLSESPPAAHDAPAQPGQLSQLVRNCKDQIAEAAGTSSDNVSITIQI